MDLKVFNIVSRVNETRFSVQHDSCECKCGLNEIDWQNLYISQRTRVMRDKMGQRDIMRQLSCYEF